MTDHAKRIAENRRIANLTRKQRIAELRRECFPIHWLVYGVVYGVAAAVCLAVILTQPIS